MKIDILGTEYTMSESDVVKDDDLEGLGGYTDFDGKDIVINSEIETKSMKNVNKRHEIIHAFLYESGLDSASWGRNEEVVDWIALQFPKILEAINHVGAL